MRSRLLSASLLAGGLLVSGCGTGLHATTYTLERSPRDFQGQSLGDLQVRDLGIAPPTSGSTFSSTDTAVLTGGIVNTGSTADALVAVESAAAGTATLQLDGKPVQTVPLPANGDAGQWSVQLTGLKGDLHVGQYVPVTLVFQNAGRLADLQVPIRAGDTGAGDRSPAQDPYHSAE